MAHREVQAGEHTELEAMDYADGVIRFRKPGDVADRIQVFLDGTVKVGNGTAAPAAVVTAEANVAVDDSEYLHVAGTTLAEALASIDAALEALQP